MNLIEFRPIYFASLFSSFIYFSILIIVLGKTKNTYISQTIIYILSLLSFTVPILYFLRVKGKMFTKNYRLYLILGHIPLISGFLFSIFGENYIYFLIMYPVFILNYLILLPWRKNELER